MKRKNTYYFLAILFIGMMGFSACKKEGLYGNYHPVNQYDGSIYDYLKSQPDHFQYMLSVLDEAGLAKMLQQDSLTFFAPTDQSLLSAMDKYNVYRLSRDLPPVTIDDIDSSSWRSIITPYIVRGVLEPEDFSVQDGLTMTTVALRPMHGQLVKHNASGAEELGTQTVELSYLNGSKYIKDWLSTFVSTPNLHTRNGNIYILESRHVLGFNFFTDKAKAPQNIYSEARTFADGQVTDPDGNIRLWSFYVKSLTAVNANTVQTEAVTNAMYSGMLMQMTVDDNDSVTIKPAPTSSNMTIQNDGPCYFDKENLDFVLNYSYEDAAGKHVVTEIIRYIALRTN